MKIKMLEHIYELLENDVSLAEYELNEQKDAVREFVKEYRDSHLDYSGLDKCEEYVRLENVLKFRKERLKEAKRDLTEFENQEWGTLS